MGAARDLGHRLYHGETTYDFVGRRRIGFALSGVLILISVVSLLTRGLDLGIDFEGGVAWEFPSEQVSVDDAADRAGELGLEDPEVQTLSGAGGDRIRVGVGPLEEEERRRAQEGFAELAGVPVDEVSVNAVGPTWGEEITEKAVRAMVVFFVLVALVITIRFEWRMAVAALAAVVHDILISVGVYSVLSLTVTPATVVAFLTILGFSLYDTIVVFDKVHENSRAAATGKATYSDVVNLSMNQVLMRSLNTSLAATLPVLSLLLVGSVLLGATALEDFALALLVGLITGSYSSIFIATPILALLKEREPRYRKVRERLEGRGPVGAAAAAAAGRAQPVLVGAAPAAAGPTRPEPELPADLEPVVVDPIPVAQPRRPATAPARPPAARATGERRWAETGQAPRPRKKKRRS